MLRNETERSFSSRAVRQKTECMNNFFTMKIDMTTCDRMSASSLFILAAMEATASKHSSWKGLNLQIDSISYTVNRAYLIYKGIVAIHATCLAGDE